MASSIARLTGRILDAVFSVYGLLVLASVVYCWALFGDLDNWGRCDWDQFTFRYATPRLAMIRDGQLPLWNPYVGGGNVLLAHPHCPAFSPWYLPTLLLGAPLGLKVSVLMFVILGTTGMAALLRRLGCGSAGCFTGGMLLMFGGHFAMHVTEGHLEWCLLGLVPWILLCLILARDRWRFTILAALLLASAILHGSVYILVVFAPMLVVWSVLEGIRKGSVRQPVVCCAAMGLSFLFCAAVLLPRIEFMRSNPRKTTRLEQVSPRAFPWMFLDPGQAELYRSTCDLRNPPEIELERITREQSPEARLNREMQTWHRLEVEAKTTSDWTDVRFEDFPYVLIVDGTAEDDDLPLKELDATPLSTEGLAIRRTAAEGKALPEVVLRGTLYVHVPRKGDLKIVNTRGNSGTTRLRIMHQGRIVRELNNIENVPGDEGNHRETRIPRDVLCKVEPGPSPWYRLQAVLKTNSDWADATVLGAPYLFRVEQPRVEMGSRKEDSKTEEATRFTARALAVSRRSPDDPPSVIRTVIWFQSPRIDDVRIRLRSGSLGKSSLELRAAEGELLETVVEKVPGAGNENHRDYVLTEDFVRDKLLPVATPWRWRLDNMGMTYDWHEYTCYVTWLGLALAAFGLVVSMRRMWPLYATGLFAGLVVLGAAGPFDLWALGKMMPMYGSLQVSARFLMVVMLAAAVAAGLGLDRVGRWVEKYRGKKTSRAVGGVILLVVYAELLALGWNLFGDIFVCRPRAVPTFDTFAQRYVEDDVRYSAMYSAHYPYMLGNSGVLRHYENICVPQGKVRLEGRDDYRGEAYLQKQQGKADIDRWTMAQVDVSLEVKAPDRLVLNQNYFKGWKAKRRTADGELIGAPAEANADGLVSVAVQPGDTEVELYYLPDSFLVGSAISLFTLPLCLLLLVMPGRVCESRPARCMVSIAAGLWRKSVALFHSRIFIRLLAVAALNIPFVVCHPRWSLPDENTFAGLLVRSLAVNLVIFILPGVPLVWLMVRRCWRPKFELLWVVAASTAVFFVVLAIAKLRGQAGDACFAWNATWAATVAAMVACLFAGVPDRWSQRLRNVNLWTGVGVFAVTYAMLFHGAVSVVPPMEDLDYEGQGTAPSLVKHFEPRLLTDRDSAYYYAHPPLLHFYMGGSFLYFDRLDRLAVFEDAWDRAEAAQRGEEVTPAVQEFYRLPNKWLVRNEKDYGKDYEAIGSLHRIVGQDGAYYLIEPPLPERGGKVSVREFESQMLYDHYRQNPRKAATRSPNVFLAAMAVGIMAWWIGQMCGRWWLAALISMAFTTSPEMFVRSVYGGYTAINNFLLLQILLLAEVAGNRRDRYISAGFLLAGALAGLANQKLVPMIAALVLWEMLRGFSPEVLPEGMRGNRETGDENRLWPARVKRMAIALLHPAAIGFALGTVAFWLYGMIISPKVFYFEHIRHHLIDRVTHDNPLGYGNYPSVWALWLELSQHTGYILLPLGIVALAVLCWKKSSSAHETTGLGWRSTSSLWAVWAVITAVIFSAIDWRQTKHLMPLLIPFHLAPARCTLLGRAALVVVSLAMVGLLLWNLDALRMLSIDFSRFTITPAW